MKMLSQKAHAEDNMVKMCVACIVGSQFPPLEKDKLRLYSMRLCPFSHRTRLILAHKKIPYETVNINLQSKPEWFLERNPLGLVPVLEKNGRVVYESSICNDYIDAVYPGKKLSPSDPYPRARDQMLVERFSKVIGPHYKLLRSQGGDQEAKDTYLSNLDVFEAELAKRGTYFGGSTFSNLDFLLWPYFERWVVYEVLCKFKHSPQRYPNLTAWINRMYQVPAVKECMFNKDTHIAYSRSENEKKPNYDIGL